MLFFEQFIFEARHFVNIVEINILFARKNARSGNPPLVKILIQILCEFVSLVVTSLNDFI